MYIIIQGTCQSFQLFALISSFWTQNISIFLLCLGLIDMLSANQNAEIFVCILLSIKQVDNGLCWAKAQNGALSLERL